MLNKYGKLLLGAYILKKLGSRKSHNISRQKGNGMLSKYSKLILSAYLMRKLRAGISYGTRGHEESTGGMLKKYGKLMLTTYAVKKLQSGKSHEKIEQPEQHMKSSVGSSLMHAGSSLAHVVKKYGKWIIGIYVLKKLHHVKKLHHEKSKGETKEIVATKTYEEKGSSMVKFGAIVMGVLAGATAIYAFKKYRAKHHGYRIEVE